MLLWLAGAVYRHSAVYRNTEINEGTLPYHEMPEAVSFAVFGPSHGREDFLAADYGDGFFNFALSSQTPQYDLMMMREYQERIEPGATVVLTVSYLSPFWTDSSAEFEKKQGKYYRLLDPQNIVECSVGRWVLSRFSPLTTDFPAVVTTLLHPEIKTVPDEVRRAECMEEERLDEERLRIRESHVTTIEPAMPDGNPVMLDAYRKILAMCAENGWNAVLVTPPYPEDYNDCFSEEILGRFRALTEGLSAECGVEWLDYSTNAEFAKRLDYYMDIDHLNAAGAGRFSEIVQADLAELGLWQG